SQVLSSYRMSLYDLYLSLCLSRHSFFLFNTPSPTEIYTLSLHDALPILETPVAGPLLRVEDGCLPLEPEDTRVDIWLPQQDASVDRKSTRLNSSHVSISYAVFCLKKKKKRF